MTTKTENDEKYKICAQGATFAEKERTSVPNTEITTQIFQASGFSNIFMCLWINMYDAR